MRVEAYMSSVELANGALTIRGKGLGKAALGSAERVIPLEALESVFLKKASMMVNGQLELVTARGKTLVHFRRKSQAEIDDLYRTIIESAPPGLKQGKSDVALDQGHVGDKLAGLAGQETSVEQRRQELRAMLAMVQEFKPIDAAEAASMGVMLAKDERLYCELQGAACIEVKQARGQFRGTSQGLSLRVAKGVTYRVGASRGHYVPGPESPTPVDVGTVLITDQRVVFRGERQSREWKFAYLTGLEHSDEGFWTALPVTNRQKTSGIGYGEQAADDVRLRLQLATADYHGSRDHLRRQIEQELHRLEALP